MRPTGKMEYIIASHVQTDGPSQALRDYLVAQHRRVALIACPLADASIPRANVTCYAGGEITAEYSGHGRHAREKVRLWLKDFWFVLKWTWRLGDSRTVFVGVDSLNAWAGILGKTVGRARSVIYYVIDYTPRRFASKWLNAVYQGICRFVSRRADWVWNLSERMREVHTGAFGSPPARNLLVPIGVDFSKLRVAPEAQVDPQRLVMVSTLYPNKGVQLAIEALTFLPEAQLTIIGSGPYGGELQALAKTLGVEARVRFLGAVDRDTLFAEVAVSRVALATYRPDDDTYSFFADPAKPKEYLACGVPVVITRVPWIAEPIEQLPMGKVIEFQAEALSRACESLMKDHALWRQCRTNALKFMESLGWETIFRKALSESKVENIQTNGGVG